MNTQIKHGLWIIPIVFLTISSCNSVDYSSLTGKELRIPEKLKNNRLELHADGNRTIYWIGEDFDRNRRHIRELIDEITPVLSDLRSDVFILVNRNLEKEFKAIETQVPVTVYYVDENVLNFPKTAQKRKKSFPSSLIKTDSGYVIKTAQELRFLSLSPSR